MPERTNDHFSVVLDSLACPQCAVERRWVTDRRPHKRTNSTTAIVRCSDCGAKLFVKRTHGPSAEKAAQRAEHEFLTMTDVHKRFPASDKLAVVKPLWQQGNTLVFEHIDGHSPTAELDMAPLHTAVSLMERCGAWFAAFHKACGERQQEIDLENKLIYMQSNPPRHDIADKALGFLQEHLDEVVQLKLIHRRLHGDAKPDNLLLNGAQLVGIDIDGSYWNPPEYDLAQFLTQFEINAGGLFGHIEESRRQALEKAFLRGYQDKGQVCSSIFHWLRVYFLMSFWKSFRGTNFLNDLRWDIFFQRRMRVYLNSLP